MLVEVPQIISAHKHCKEIQKIITGDITAVGLESITACKCDHSILEALLLHESLQMDLFLAWTSQIV